MEICYLCGNSGAALIELRGVSSRIIWFNVRTLRGPVCPECAEAAYGVLQYRTLTQGWWGPLSLIVTLWNSIANVMAISKHRAIAPMVTVGRASVPRRRAQVRNSPGPWIATLVAAVLVIFIGAVLIDRETSKNAPFLGSCWTSSGQDAMRSVSCASGDADYVVSNVVSDPQKCADFYLDDSSGYGCLRPW